MKYLAFYTNRLRPARRTAPLLCAALLGLGLAASPRTSAQVTGPLAAPYASPPQPTPFQWQNYHSGGAPIPATQFPVPPDPNAALSLTPLIDPLQSQLQGTPTELYNGSLTEIPSFLLGNYDPTLPPGPLVNGNLNFYPNHFADGGIVPWSAPFSFVDQGTGTVSVDDAPIQAPTATASGFTITGNWVSVTDPNGTNPGNTTSPAAATATGDEYLRLPPGVPGTAIWTLDEPVAGVYSVYFHIPNDLPDSNGIAEVRDTQVLYFIRVLDANGSVTASTTATASQTEANDSQLLAGPFQVAAGGSVVVTLTRSLSNPVINYNPTRSYNLVADSMTLQQTVGDVQSAPTVITQKSYQSDFNNVQYWGRYISPTANATLSLSTDPATAAAENFNPDTTTGDAAGYILLKSGDPTKSLDANGAQDPTREIRQLVYFGRSDPSASVTSTVDDSAGLPGFSGSGTLVSAPTTPTAVTASNSEYRVSSATTGKTPTSAVATWTVPVPAAGAGSNFFVYAHIPATAPGELRLPSVFYTVTVTTGVTAAALPIQTTYNAAISQQTQGADALVVLPTGALNPAPGTNIVVTMYSQNNSSAPSPTGTVVVADSVNVSTGSGQGAIYCVDGFTGGVVWRFETPGSANGASAPVFASPAIAKINVIVTPATAATPAVYANKLVVIVGDNNGLVYCLDAIGNGDGTSNFDVLNPATLQPITIPQPAYGTVVPRLAPGTPAATAALTAHAGTTGVYWIYRPDATQPKYVTGTATQIGTVKPTVDPTTDLPVPAAFNTASPVIFVDPTIVTATPTASNSTVYIGSSNGVLYALDGGGASIDGSGTPPIGGGPPASFRATGDRFNVSQDLQQSQSFPKLVIPTTQPKWWFTLRGVDPNGAGNTSSADIESAPALYVKRTTDILANTTAYVPTVYIGSAHEQEATSNVGRLYALNGVYGPSGNNGRSSPLKQPNPAAANYTGPGSYNYNVGQIPQISTTDTADWSFPDGVGKTAYATGKSSDGLPRPALGNITGSPVVFTNIHETVGNPTRIYVAANSGLEPTAATLNPTARPDATQTGRIWAVNLDGSVGTTTNSGLTGHVWSYPVANNPNDKTKDNVAEPYPPIGSFLRATPAIGFVQFPAAMNFIPTAGGGISNFSPVDAVQTTNGIAGQSVPMLYVGTRGNDDKSLYAVDIDGDMTALPANVTVTASGTAQNDQRTIYRLVTPDGSIYQSSPALVTNATSAGGNGGSVYAVAGNTMYDYSATPISNPFAGNNYPLIRQNRVFVGLGPISSPALAGADASDYLSAQPFLTGTNTTGSLNNSGFKTLTVDWVIIGDSASGFCRGITPQDLTYGGFVTDLLRQVPPDPNAPLTQLLTAEIQTFLVPDLTTQNRTSSKADGVGTTAPLPVYDWGESAYACFTNVAPPNPKNDTALYVYDHVLYPDLSTASMHPIPFYTSDGTTAETVTFNLSDVEAATGSTGALQTDNGSVLPANYFVDPGSLTASPATPAYTQAVADVVQNLRTTTNTKYIGTYTYTIGDGSARNNTPGARRRFLNVHQVVTEYDYDGQNYKRIGNVVIGGDATSNNIATAPDGKSFIKVAAVDQPTFGILNPLAVRGGGVSLVPVSSVNAVPVGDEAGPFRAVIDTKQTALPTFSAPGTGDVYGLQALTNGNAVLSYAPPSSSGVGSSPVALPNPATDPNAAGPTTIEVVVTATGLISHNSIGDNSEPRPTLPPQGTYNSGTDGLVVANSPTGYAPFGGYSLNAADRSALFSLGQTLRLKSSIPPAALNVPSRPNDGLFWNSNVANPVTDHDSVVNFLPWEIAPTPYSVGINSSLDYPDIAPGNVAQNIQSVSNSANPPVANSAGDLTSNSVTLTPGVIGGTTNGGTPIQNRTVYGDPVQIKITVPHYQPPNQQLYQQTGGSRYLAAGEIAPVNPATGQSSINPRDQVFPMGYIASKRLFVPSGSGRYSDQRPYRDVHIFTGVPVDIRTSVVNPTTDIGQVPAAFGVQTESYAPLGLFTPYNPAFTNPDIIDSYFKPLTVHNDGNVNLLNAHFDQIQQGFTATGALTPQDTLHLYSDTDSLLSVLDGFDLNGSTGPHAGYLQPSLPEQSYLVRTSLDSDIFRAYGQNPYFGGSYSAAYPGATFHKPRVGSDQPSTLTVPDAPDNYVANASLNSQPVPTLGTDPSNPGPNNSNLPFKSAPFVSIAVPFGTPVGTYMTNPAGSLRLFEGLDTAAASAYNLTVPPANSPAIPAYLYPPKYGGAVGGIGGYTTSTLPPAVDSGDAGQPKDAYNYEDVYNGLQPISTTGTVLSGRVVEQRLTDGFTYGAVPMVDAGPAGKNTQGIAVSTSDFAPAAFRDPASGYLSVYWTSGRGGGYSIYGANAQFINNNTGAYFFPTSPAQYWWGSINGYANGTLAPLALASAPGTAPSANSGLSISAGSPPAGANLYAFDVFSTNAPYTDTLYSYLVTPQTGVLGSPSRLSPVADDSQVKYGIKGLYTGTSFASANWAFWTANTRGRTALYYSPQSAWGAASFLLPVPAGLTAVSDASPLLMTAPAVIGGSLTYTPTIEVTYSGTGPDGNADLYVSRYLPDAKTPTLLDLVPFPAVTENLHPQGNTGWYQGRDTAWSRSGALNVIVPVTSTTGAVTTVTPHSLLYDGAGKPLFTQAIYDKASGFLVLTGVQVPFATQPASGTKGTTNTIYVDAATGRIRFSPALIAATQSYTTIQATFSPLARRLTITNRSLAGPVSSVNNAANVGPVTFLDTKLKPNDAALVPNSVFTAPVEADRRWTIWRKTGVAGVGSTATLYFKTQRLTLFLPTAVDPARTITVNVVGGSAVSGFDLDSLRGRLYFPILANVEGQSVTVSYTDLSGTVHTGPTGPTAAVTDIVQWQDEAPANTLATTGEVLPTDTVTGLDTVIDTLVPILTATNENNVAAFLDPFASATSPHKVWLFWNSTRNGTADIYSETIDPRFAPTPTIP